MADFCTTCVARWANNDLTDTRTIEEIYDTIAPDIDVFEIFNSLTPGYGKGVGICEGCGLAAVMKTAEGELKVAYYDFNARPDDVVKWVDYPDLRKGPDSLYRFDN